MEGRESVEVKGSERKRNEVGQKRHSRTEEGVRREGKRNRVKVRYS